ncbi:MAG: hypothetical protein HZA24_02865 [Nitrospirae bacterium]|nr:hypothetical protein [Nitrospirota bacterium]
MKQHTPGSDFARGPERPALASREMADLYVKQGNYERGIDMYRHLLEREPDATELRERLEDAETLADLLTVRDETQVYDKGFREGYTAGRTQAKPSAKDVKIATLTAWLNRIQAER